MNAILVFVALLGSALCELPITPQPPQVLPELKKQGEARPFRGMMEGKRQGRRGLFGNNFDSLSEAEKAELERKREEIKKEVREKMVKLIADLNDALDKQTRILDDKSLSHKDRLKALRVLRKENPKVYNVLQAIFQQFVPKPKFGRRNGFRQARPGKGFGNQGRKSIRGWEKRLKERKSPKNKPFGPKQQLPELMKPMRPKLEIPAKA